MAVVRIPGGWVDMIDQQAAHSGIPREELLHFSLLQTASGSAPEHAGALYGQAQAQLEEARALPLLSGQPRANALDAHLALQQGGPGYAAIQGALAGESFAETELRDQLLQNMSLRQMEQVTGSPFGDVTALDDRGLAQAFTDYWAGQHASVERAVRGEAAQATAMPREGSGVLGPTVWPVPGNGSQAAQASLGGLDFRGEHGDPVLAFAAGLATVTPNSGPAGNAVRIVHGDGAMSRYFHLDTALVADGAEVGAGQQVGTMGTSGRPAEPGVAQLHFDLWRDGSRVNPWPELALSGGAPLPGGASRPTREETGQSAFVDQLFAALRSPDEGGLDEVIAGFSKGFEDRGSSAQPPAAPSHREPGRSGEDPQR